MVVEIEKERGLRWRKWRRCEGKVEVESREVRRGTDKDNIFAHLLFYAMLSERLGVWDE